MLVTSLCITKNAAILNKDNMLNRNIFKKTSNENAVNRANTLRFDATYLTPRKERYFFELKKKA
jgi:CTP:phosphocholine cytidylyltransferase-like protein